MKIFLLQKIKYKLAKLLSQDDGAIAIIVGLVGIACIGFAALAIDVGLWYSQKRQLQLAADAGAVGGALALSKTGENSINAYVTHDVALNNCTSANNCSIVAVNNPPTSGPNAGNSTAVEVILSQPIQFYLANLFLTSSPTLTTRAVAIGSSITNCLIALNSSGSALRMTGTSSIYAPNCEIYVDSADSSALSMTSESTITTQKVNIVGGFSGEGTINASQGVTTGASATNDPYIDFTIPSYSGCNQTNFSTSSSTTLSPGVYCGGIDLSGGTTTLNSGIYYINDGDFKVAAPTTVTGSNVTIILTSSTGSNYGSVQISGGATVNLTAPASGPTRGFLFYGDRNSIGLTHSATGGTSQLLDGILYFPSSTIQFAGGSFENTPTCLQVVAKNIEIVGQAVLNSNCGVYSRPPWLVE